LACLVPFLQDVTKQTNVAKKVAKIHPLSGVSLRHGAVAMTMFEPDEDSGGGSSFSVAPKGRQEHAHVLVHE
jgi:hypothetical protein